MELNEMEEAILKHMAKKGAKRETCEQIASAIHKDGCLVHLCMGRFADVGFVEWKETMIRMPTKKRSGLLKLTYKITKAGLNFYAVYH